MKKGQGQEMYQTFIDIEKTHDTVDRRTLITLLEHISVLYLEELITRIRKPGNGVKLEMRG